MMLLNAVYGKILNGKMLRKKDKRTSKKGQFKIQQMAFMLLAVFLFFILAGLFWLALQSRNLQRQAVQLQEEQAILMAEFLSSASEFSCGSYCIDTDKIMILMNRQAYQEFWPVSYIKIRKLYPKQDDKECNKGNYPNCNIYNIYENKEIKSDMSVGSFVALCRYEQVEGYPTRVCELGRFIIGYEAR